MELLAILIAFGSGVFAASIGALGAFVFTGFTGMIGVGVILAGGSFDFLGQVAFGLFGPHVSFAAGVAAAAYAANKKKLLGDANGTDIATPLFTVPDASVILVGGIFGMLGYVINWTFGTFLTADGFGWDTIALTVAVSGMIVRIVFGSTGLIGTYEAADKKAREWFPKGQYFMFLLILSLGLGLAVAQLAISSGVLVIGFVISAASLVFAMGGKGVPATHHITIIAGWAGLASGSVYIGAAFAVLAMVVMEVWGLVFNSHNDTHIDPPAGAIAICSILIELIF